MQKHRMSPGIPNRGSSYLDSNENECQCWPHFSRRAEGITSPANFAIACSQNLHAE